MELPCGVILLIYLSSLLHCACPTRILSSTQSGSDLAPASSPISSEISYPKTLSQIFASVKNQQVNSKLQEICEKSAYPAICVSTTIPYLNGTYDPISILDMEIQALIKGLELAKEEVLGASTDEYCARIYDEAIQGAKSAREGICTKANVNVGLNGVLTLIQDCRDDIRAGRTTSAIAPTNSMLSKLARNCLWLEASSVDHRTS